MRVEGSFQTEGGWYFEPVLGGGVRVHAAATSDPLVLDAETWDEVIAFVEEVQEWGDAVLASLDKPKAAAPKRAPRVRKSTTKAAPVKKAAKKLP